ncbi:hypothetical protein HNS03_24545 [Amorphus sp. 3PC139-8]
MEALLDEIERRGTVILIHTTVDAIAEMAGTDAGRVRTCLPDIKDAVIDSEAADAIDEVCARALESDDDTFDFD